MNQSLIVRGAPQEYICQIGAWLDLDEHLKKRKIKNALVLHGKKSWEVAKHFFPKEVTTAVLHFAYYKGDCTRKNSLEFQKQVEENQYDAIISVGGGKVTDLGKLVAASCNIPFIVLPTLAATCAAYTPLSVIYTEQGEMDEYVVFPHANSLVLIEPQVILNSPVSLMIAGIGDTLAKWYEADAMICQLENPPVEIEIAAYTARLSREYLLKYSDAALAAMKDGKISDEFIKIIETNILLGGMVGGFGDDYGRTSGAHSIHDALTVLPETHQFLHGEKVAYGILVQLMLENKLDEIDFLLPFYRRLNLPTNLQELNLPNITSKELQLLAERATLPFETIHFMEQEITAEKVSSAILDLEEHLAKKKI